MSGVRTSAISDGARAEVFQLSEAGKISESDISGDRELRDTYRTLARESLYFLCKAVLGYNRLTVSTHWDLCQRTQDMSIKRQLALMPRGTYKTTVRSKGFPIWALLNDPNLFILVGSQTSSKAYEIIREIQLHLDGSNALMNWLFPEYIKPDDRWGPWSQDRLTLPCRDVLSGTPSILALGRGARAEGFHFGMVITDDLIGEKDMESETGMLDAVIWHDNLNSLFISPKEGIERASGTRWSLSDLYSLLKERGDYDIIEHAAEDPRTGELFFPELLDRETLRKIKENNYALYMSQYMNDPENKEALEFQRDWLKEYQLVGGPRGPRCEYQGEAYDVADMDVVLAVDPAASGDVASKLSSEMKKARSQKSNNAVEVWGLHGSGKYFLLDMWVGRGVGENPELQVAREMLRLFRAWKGYIRKGFVESYGAQRALITIFKMLLQGTPENYQLEEIPRSIQKAKNVRIRSYMGGPAQNGVVHVRPGHDAFVYEFSKFPQSNMMDTLDAAAWAFSQLRRPQSNVERQVTRKQKDAHRARRMRMINNSGY